MTVETNMESQPSKPDKLPETKKEGIKETDISKNEKKIDEGINRLSKTLNPKTNIDLRAKEQVLNKKLDDIKDKADTSDHLEKEAKLRKQ